MSTSTCAVPCNATRRAFLSRLYQAGALDRCSFEWLYLPPRGDIRYDYQRRPLRDMAAVAAFLKAKEMGQSTPLMVRRGIKSIAIDCMHARMMEGTEKSAGIHVHIFADEDSGQRKTFAELLTWWNEGLPMRQREVVRTAPACEDRGDGESVKVFDGKEDRAAVPSWWGRLFEGVSRVEGRVRATTWTPRPGVTLLRMTESYLGDHSYDERYVVQMGDQKVLVGVYTRGYDEGDPGSVNEVKESELPGGWEQGLLVQVVAV